ncbi:hypothetical protein KY321_01720 [Candidatus Woesearchaeota archaeon]|nr:hypothetical protein [Candidatus Woesearchaeota archaeon]
MASNIGGGLENIMKKIPFDKKGVLSNFNSALNIFSPELKTDAGFKEFYLNNVLIFI